MLRAFVLILLVAAPATAGTLVPQLHDVTGVQADDVLYIREAPNARSNIIGEFPPDAQGIEVVEVNPAGTWGRVNTAERSGWVSLHYLAPRGVHIDNYNMPVGLRCLGNEPFWSLHQTDGRLEFRTPEGAQGHKLEFAQDSMIPGDLTRMLHASGDLTAYIHPAACSDGMSDRRYGLAIGLMTGRGGPLLKGCCTLSP